DIKKIQVGRRGDNSVEDGSPPGVKEEMQQQLEVQKQEYEEKMRVLTLSNLEADELKAEKKQMEEKLKMVQEEMQRMLEIQAQAYKEKMAKLTAAQATFDPRHFAEPRPYTDGELRLIRKTLKKWKRQRYVQMAETILSNAVVLKEANVISRELKKDIQYQLTIIEDEPYTNPVSFYETTSALNQYNTNEDTSLHLSKKPCVGVKVIDFKNGVVYVWSLDKLKARMQKMRNLYNYIDRPQYSKHFNWEDPFYENPCPQFTFIGSASMALRCLILKSEYEQRVPVICRYSGKAIAQCLIRIKFISDSKQSKDPSENTVFEVRIEELTGMNEEQYSQVHIQFKLSSFGAVPPLSSGEHIYATDFKSDFGTGPIRFDYAQTLSVALTPAIVEVLTNGMLAFEIYGKAKPCVLQQIEKWDEIQANTGDFQPERVIPRERRSEEELVAEEKHDVVSWVQVCEMAPSGDYVPVQVLSQNSLDPGAFFLRQGLQRRIVLTLTHNSGRQFPWTRVSKMEIGHVRLLDGKGRLAESPTQNDVQMNIVPPQKVDFNIDGTSTLVAQCSWDSTLHGSLFLNRTTQSNSRVLLRLTWYVEAEKCVEPICFNMDIAVQIQGREARPPSRLIQLLNSSKVLWKTSGLFSITLKPPMTRKISELWRLNTANKYVRGEELLGNWKPRGVSLVKDYKRISESIRKQEAVEFMKQVYNIDETRITVAGASSKMGSPARDEKELYKKVCDLWMKKWGTTKEIVINQDPPLSGSYPDAETYKHTKDTKLVAQVRMVGKTDQITKKGYLYTPENADDYWVKRWYVLRRPYLFIYESKTETEELGAINLSSVRVDYMKEREDMLKRQYVFSIYTNNNAYMLQASSKQEMIDWISKIDQFYQIANLD
ncbi:4861_t:CDS:2, partial [Paraglomus occultum]